MDKNELYKMLCKTEKQVESARIKRTMKTVIAFAVVFFLLFYFTDKPEGLEIVGCIVASILLSGVYFVINATVFGGLFRISQSEQRRIEELRKQLSEATENKK